MGNYSRQWGEEAEQIAADYLLMKGYTVRERNWRYKNLIEIDIIAQTGNTVIFVEVKARSKEDGDPIEAVDNKKMLKMVRGADRYLSAQLEWYDCRFDIISISGNASDYDLKHIETAFIPPLSAR